MNKKFSIIIVAVAIVAIATAGLFFYKWCSLKTAVPQVGDNFTSGNPVMDRLQFTDENTPATKKYAETLYNPTKSDITVVGSWVVDIDDMHYKQYSTRNYCTSIFPSYNDGTLSLLYSVMQFSGTDITEDPRDVYQMSFICNGKEIKPISAKNYPVDETGLPNAGESLTFADVKDGDDFVVIVYNSVDRNAVAFPFVINHANIYG